MLSYKKILVPVDFTQISSSALAEAARHSQASGSRLFVAHIVDPESVLTEAAGEAVKRDAKQKIDRLLDDSEVGYCEKVVELGETVPMLMQVIKQHSIDLVVIGTNHFNSLENSVSVTRALGESIQCDILILHK